MKKRSMMAWFVVGLAAAGCSDASPSEGTPPAEVPQAFAACEGQEFTLTEPNPMYVWTPKAIRLASQELAPGVFVIYDENADAHAPMGIPLATSGGFVVGADSVLLVESMINRQLFCQVVDLVRKETNKPIRYVVNTSSHGDHSFGNTFLPSGVHIVQHERTAKEIAEHFEEDVAFMEANFGADQGLDELKAVAADILVKDGEPWTIDLGGLTVEARYHGFAQTGGDLFVRVPSAKVLWTGNALVAEKPAVPWLLAGHAAETGMTLADVKASLPADAIVVPGHGRPVTVDGFDFAIDYLGTLVTEVGAAVSSGKTKDEAVMSVTMESFKGYAIWDWIHTTVNVPSTYDDLSP
ncbi:MBL fold metallo-hydrolase [Polyangium sorediatum]|uniref:MBL fold metallo-hydrolase n=1 Tax=Polyangium sorediatum TaxID=889274 RepID=A0ABT6P2K7_9BACT|nr:MBL fold metallo-hydrolase [Polyangium sorediatum]MDI1434784.1 MBL fold metallo-hydrolase [Polyangium sorediatum]